MIQEKPSEPISSSSSLNTFNSSQVPWRSLVVKNFKAECLSVEQIPENHTLRELTLKKGIFTWSWLKEFIGRFESLENLSIVECIRTRQEDEGWFQTPEEFRKFSQFQRRVRFLSFEFDGRARMLNFYVRMFTCPHSKLEGLRIVTRSFSCQDYGSMEYGKGPAVLCNLVQSCSSTLKSLVIEITSYFTSLIGEFLNRLVQNNVQVNISEFHLKVSLVDGVGDSSVADKEQFFIISFLKTQSNLKSLGLPEFQTMAEDELIAVFPRNLTQISICEDSLPTRTPEVFKILNNAEELGIKCQIGTSLLQYTKNEEFPKLESLNIDGNICGLFLGLILGSFPNLIKLCIDVSAGSPHVSLTDNNLQTIILTLSYLKSLKLANCKFITDFGVTGIKATDTAKLLDSRLVYSDLPLTDLGIARAGVPLSSLQCKTKVINILFLSKLKPYICVRGVVAYADVDFHVGICGFNPPPQFIYARVTYQYQTNENFV